MAKAKILQLVFGSSSYLGESAQDISRCYTAPEFSFRRVAFEPPKFERSDLAQVISEFDPDLILAFLPVSPMQVASATVGTIKSESPDVPIIVVTEAGRPDEILTLLERGATDFATLPIKAIDILSRTWRLLGKASASQKLAGSLKEKLGLKRFIGKSEAFVAEIKKIPVFAKCDATVMILGETGTGKEICARAIHYLSTRGDRPFVPINCGAIPTELAENELFGHERGAFTGASTSQIGLIQEADGGSLFLDEIDCLPRLVQVKLLRFLQEKEFRPLGSSRMRRADARIIAATNLNIEEAVRDGRLRKDLYYRLNIILLTLPPLRERKEDIPLLARHFLEKYAGAFDTLARDFSPDAIEALLVPNWPGNVRELEHVVERAAILSERQVLTAADLRLPQREVISNQGSFQTEKAMVVAQFERNYIDKVLTLSNGNITKAARAAQKNRRAFWQLIQKHSIDTERYRNGRSS
jgi:two-component system, NtrC family, response regulator GlrR